MKEIKLTQNKVALVDDEDFERLSQYKWHAIKIHRSWYARRAANGKRIYMHRELINTEQGYFIDHINRNGLDNRRQNIRACSISENNRNTSSHKGSSSKYLGVYWDSNKNKWKASISYKNKVIHLGRYSIETQAALAYNLAAAKYFGEFANLNIIQS